MGTIIDIDHRALTQMAGKDVVRDVIVIGQPGGWCVEVELNGTRGRLISKRGTPRLFGRLETLASYLKQVGIQHFSVQTENFEPAPAHKRPDAAERMTRTHEAAEYDAWFRRQVEEALEEASRPGAEWVDNAAALDRVRQRIKNTIDPRDQDAR